MNFLPRRAAAAVAPLVLAVVLTGCGDDGDEGGSEDTSPSASSSSAAGSDDSESPDGEESSAPEDGDEDAAPGADPESAEFCEAFRATPQGGDEVEGAHEFAESLREVGTPPFLEGDAAEGLDIYVSFLEDVEEDDVDALQGSEGLGDIFGEEDAAKVDAFITAAVQECFAGLSTETPTPAPSPSS